MTQTLPAGAAVTRAPRRIPFARTEIAPEAQRAALQVLQSGWVTTGAQAVAFEQDLAAHVGARHVLAVSSCTAALELALRALRLPDSAPVLTPSLTFCGAVQAIIHAGLRPVLVDVDADTLTPTAATVARAATRAGRPSALVVQHQAGYPVEVGELAAAAGLPPQRVVQDAAHGLGARFSDGTPLGARGHAVCLSFYATKNLPIGEGGAVLTDDDDLADDVARARLHGMTRDSWARYHPGGSWRYSVDAPGLKANFTDLQAAIGRAQLRRLDAWQARRVELAARYDAALAGVPGVRLPARPAAGTHAWHLYQVRLTERFGTTRDAAIGALSDRGIGSSVHFIPVHHLPYFRDLLGPAECGAVPVTDVMAGQLLSLPLHPGLHDAEVDAVASALSRIAAP
jgi:perosamine synthetase